MITEQPNFNDGKEWSKKDLFSLRNKIEHGRTVAQIATFLMRTETEIREKAAEQSSSERASASTRRPFLFRCIRIQEVQNGCFKLLVCQFQNIQDVLAWLCDRTGRNGNVGFAVGSYRNRQLFVMRRALMECDLHFVQFHAHPSVSMSDFAQQIAEHHSC